MKIPATMLFRHGLMIKTLLGILLQSKLSFRKRPSANPEYFEPVEMLVSPPKQDLVSLYSAWCGAPADKYQAVLPIHLFSQFTLPVCAQQLRKTRYDLSGIINQGCGLRIFKPLSANGKIFIRCEMMSIREENGRARIHQRLQVSNEGQPVAYEVDFHTTLIIGKRRKQESSEEESPHWQELGTWSARKNDGLAFALLTGDFNPLHWLRPVARLTPFRGTILHGFGSFGRSFELLENKQGRSLRNLDVRFVGPVKLPSDNIRVQLSEETDSEGYHQVRQVSKDGKVQLFGRCLFD